MTKSEGHADMSESVGDRGATRVNTGGASHQGDQSRTDDWPNHLSSLTGGDESDSPTDENRCAVIVELAGLNADILEPIDWARVYMAEGRIDSWHKDLPKEPQIDTGNEVGPGKKEKRCKTEYRPRRSDAQGLELSLLDHRLGEI